MVDARPRTIIDKIWDDHLVTPESRDRPALLYIDLHLLNEVTTPQAFEILDRRRLGVARPARTLATIDHATPTLPPDAAGNRPYVSQEARDQVLRLEDNCRRHAIPYLGWNSPDRGIVHVVAPELGLTRPGMTLVCGDSHTSTHGAFGALAFGIGTTEIAHVLATQCLMQRRPSMMRIEVEGSLPKGASAKDLTLAIQAAVGAEGGGGHAVEYAGRAVRSLSMEERMTLCNMSIEMGARAGLVAPDETTLNWFDAPERAEQVPTSRDRELWLAQASDTDAIFDRTVTVTAETVVPMVTWGVTPDTAIGVDQAVPVPHNASDRAALDYMQIAAARPIAGTPVDIVFLGSCTNGRLPDLRAAADLLRGRTIAQGVRMIVVPGSEAVRRAAEEEGLHRVFQAAGAEWRLPGCSMCLAMNGDLVPPGKLAVSTSNRNFKGRQGPGGRTVLASPATAAASAIAGMIADPRRFYESSTL
ncbi:3-isopropylmalate dehydratase large subunit [soil metagenome]